MGRPTAVGAGVLHSLMRKWALALALILLAAPAGAGEKWAALNKQAKDVTGDLEMEGNRLRFARRGETLILRPYEMARDGDWSITGDVVAGDVFKVAPITPSSSRRQKPLCKEAIRYLVLWTFGEGDLTLNLYAGDTAPTGYPEADTLCATYSYEVR